MAEKTAATMWAMGTKERAMATTEGVACPRLLVIEAIIGWPGRGAIYSAGKVNRRGVDGDEAVLE